MIFYFTGTGNSGYMAEEIAKATGDRVLSISKLMMENQGKAEASDNQEEDELQYALSDGEAVGIIFPVYAY